MNKATSEDIKERFAALRRIRSTAALCTLLGIDKLTLEVLARQPRYKAFHLPKNADGNLRLIEDPPPVLKKIQSTLNHYLQSAYYFEKSHAGYGFVTSPVTDYDKRNILTNARKHLRRPWLLQTDLCDFFHYVTQQKVQEVFRAPPLCFSEDLSELLTALTTYQGRLPMGAPSSPVLSNFACRALDEALYELAQAKLWVYTRYADDLSISSMRPMDTEDQWKIRSIIQEHGFLVNESKTRLLGPDDEKIVTGILLRNKGELRPGFYEEVTTEVAQLAAVVESQHFYGELRTYWVEKMKQQVRGKITFIGFVLGVRHPEYINLRDRFYTACAPPEETFGAVSWRGFHYLV